MNQLFGYFDGKTKGISEYVKAFRYIQMEALRYAATSIRRFGKKKSGLIVWMGNEPFPNSANTSILEFDGCPKPAFYKLKAAFADVMLGLSYESPTVRENQKLEVTLYGCSDRARQIQNIRVGVYDSFGHLLESVDVGSAFIDCTKDLAVLSLPAAAPLVIVRITADAGYDLCEEYVFTVGGETPFGALLEMPKTPVLIYPIADNRYRLINASATAALFVDCIGISEEGLPQVVNNNYRCLLPNEAIEVYTRRPCSKFSAEALNSSSKAAVSSKREAPFSCELTGALR